MKIALVTGQCPPGECGVGDYTRRLEEALRAAGTDAELIDSADWRFRSATRQAKLLGNSFDLVHVQYPTAGFGFKLGPQLLSLIRPSVITIHEVSQRTLLRKLSLAPFALRPQHVIFTSEFERDYALAWAPWISRRCSVIPVGSNIAAASPQERSIAEVVHFGLIMPKKGLEQIVELGRLIRQSELPIFIRIMGHVAPKQAQYFERLREDSAELPIVWEQALTDEEIAGRLASSAIAYFPFPDGASDRRTTLKAALQAGMAVVTTKGTHTPRAMKEAVAFCTDAAGALETIRRLIEDPLQLAALSTKATEYAGQFRWDMIAALHVGVYESVLSVGSGRLRRFGAASAR